MLKFFGTLKNNLNGKTWAITKSNLEFKDYKEISSNDKDGVLLSNQEVRDKLDELQGSVRYSNLRVYTRNIKNVGRKKFSLVTLPALLVAVTALLFTVPNEVSVSKSYDTYIKNEVQFEDGKYQIVTDDKVYCVSEFVPDFVDEEKYDSIGRFEDTKYLELYALDNLDGVYSKFTFSDKGKMYLDVDELESDTFIIDDINVSEGALLTDDYKYMFDIALDLLDKTPYLSEEEHAMLKELNNEEKTNFVARIIEFENAGEQKVEVTKSTIIYKIVSALLSGLYVFGYVLPNRKRKIVDVPNLEVNGSRLVEGEGAKEHRLCDVPLEYKAAFVAAEKNRIQEIEKIADTYLTPESKDIIFTSHEKRLLLK